MSPGCGRRAGPVLASVLAVVAGCEWYESGPSGSNLRPHTPVVSGPDTALVGVLTRFEVLVHDPDNDRLRVFVAWGDRDTTDYGDFVASGTTVGFEHSYSQPGSYAVSARCHDSEPLFSDWSAPVAVVVVAPRTGR